MKNLFIHITSRKTAKMIGLKYYYQGNPCVNGHFSRYTSNKHCSECSTAYTKQWKLDNPERWEKYKLDNHEMIMKTTRISVISYLKRNPHKKEEFDSNRRAKKKSAEGKYTREDVSKILNLQKWKCANCRSCLKGIFKGKRKYHVDHIHSLSKGGTNWPDNLQALCVSCNSKKSDLDPIDWANKNGKLL